MVFEEQAEHGPPLNPEHHSATSLTRRVKATHIDQANRPSILRVVAFTIEMSTEPTGEAYEEEHVHTVYEQIASHFSSTRYKVRSKNVPLLDTTTVRC